MFLIASIAYAISIFIDIFAYHLKFNIHDNKNVRYLFSLINIFQFSARAFVLIFVPIMAYYTETVKDRIVVWEITILAHIFVVLVLLPLYSNKFSYFFSKKIIEILNIVFGNSKQINYVKIDEIELDDFDSDINKKFSKFFFFVYSFSSGFLFSISITFLYFLSFYYPQKALTLTSYSQILNMVGVLLLVLLIDPKIMSSIDKGRGHQEIKLLTTSRILVHITLVIILFVVK
jgi:hypothetical protein